MTNLIEEMKSQSREQNIETTIQRLHNFRGQRALITLQIHFDSRSQSTKENFKKICLNCLNFSRNKPCNLPEIEKHGMIMTKVPLEQISTDLCGPFTEQLNEDPKTIYILSKMDRCT